MIVTVLNGHYHPGIEIGVCGIASEVKRRISTMFEHDYRHTCFNQRSLQEIDFVVNLLNFIEFQHLILKRQLHILLMLSRSLKCGENVIVLSLHFLG